MIRSVGSFARVSLKPLQPGDARNSTGGDPTQHSRDVVFLLMRNLLLLDLAGPADAFRNANNRVPGSYRVRFVAAKPTIPLAGGLNFTGCEPLPTQLAPETILVVMGIADQTINPHETATRQTIEWLRRGPKPTMLLCICAGSVIAAHAGLLADRECTTHHAYLDELRRVEPRAKVLDNRIFVEDHPLYTSAGVTAGLDLALHVIGRQLNPRVAADIARDLVVYMRRAGTDPALSPWMLHRNHLHPAVHRVQDAVSRDPTAHWRATELATVACTSSRNLSRLFAQYANCSPLHYVQLIRFAHAKELVAQTRLDLEAIAQRCGFRSAQNLRRVWSRWELRTPRSFRRG